MKLKLVVFLLAVLAMAAIASAQDHMMSVNWLPATPRTEVPQAVANQFRGAVSTVLSTPWAILPEALCNQRCVEGKVGLMDGNLYVQVKVESDSKGFMKTRLGAKIPDSCKVHRIFGEVKDENATNNTFAFSDPSEGLPHFRVHVFRIEGGTASMVFQNENTSKTRMVRLNIACK